MLLWEEYQSSGAGQPYQYAQFCVHLPCCTNTLTTLKTLKLPGMAAAFEEQLIQTTPYTSTVRWYLIVRLGAS